MAFNFNNNKSVISIYIQLLKWNTTKTNCLKKRLHV